jgi:hypothetical protein
MAGEAKSQTPVEPSLKVETREEPAYLLGQACEIPRRNVVRASMPGTPNQ